MMKNKFAVSKQASKQKGLVYLPIGQAAQRQWEATGELWILLLNGRVAAADATELLSSHSM